jgi:excisionase family DNA binding protein
MQKMPRLRTVKETARALRLGRSTVYRLVAGGKIHGIKIGGSVRVPDAEIERLQRGEQAAA